MMIMLMEASSTHGAEKFMDFYLNSHENDLIIPSREKEQSALSFHSGFHRVNETLSPLLLTKALCFHEEIFCVFTSSPFIVIMWQIAKNILEITNYPSTSKFHQALRSLLFLSLSLVEELRVVELSEKKMTSTCLLISRCLCIHAASRRQSLVSVVVSREREILDVSANNSPTRQAVSHTTWFHFAPSTWIPLRYGQLTSTALLSHKKRHDESLRRWKTLKNLFTSSRCFFLSCLRLIRMAEYACKVVHFLLYSLNYCLMSSRSSSAEETHSSLRHHDWHWCSHTQDNEEQGECARFTFFCLPDLHRDSSPILWVDCVYL